MELRRLLTVLREYWVLVAVVFVLGLLSTNLVSHKTTSLYTSSTIQFVRPAGSGSDAFASVATVNFVMPALTQRASSSVEHDTVQSDLPPQLQSVPFSASASNQPGTGLLTLTVASTDRTVPRLAANLYAQSLAKYPSEAALPVRLEVLEPAGPAVQASESRRLSLYVSGAVLGGLAGIAAALIASSLGRRRQVAEEVRSRLGVPVLAVLPRTSSRELDLPASQVLGSRARGWVESLMHLRGSVEVQLQSNGARSVGVVSRRPGEGAPQVAAQLAWGLAALGNQVMAVEADMREKGMEPLLNDVLRVPKRNATDGGLRIIPTSSSMLSVVRAVDYAPAAREHSSTVRLTHPVEVLRSTLPALRSAATTTESLLLVDCAPLTASESRYTVSVVDAVIVVASLRVPSALDQLEVTLAQVREAGGFVLGVVLTRQRPSGARTDAAFVLEAGRDRHVVRGPQRTSGERTPGA